MIQYNKENFMQWSRISSRYAFGEAIGALADMDHQFMVLAADVAHSANLGTFKEKYPERFINVGIAEQNMMGLASGLAKEDIPVFVTTFAPFASMRAFEALRSYLGYMKLNVKVVALASGVSMGVGGNTHYGLEDIALARTIPGMLVLSPADCTETVKCVEALINHHGPAYLRLTGVNANPMVYKEDYPFEIGKSICLKDGHDVAILATGTMVNESVRATRRLEKEGISCAVYNVHTIKPLDHDMLDDVADRFKLIVTIEEHHTIGGLGGAVAEYLAPKKHHIPQLMMGIADQFPHAGDYAYVLKSCGLTAEHIIETIQNAIKQY